jgi:hypothetical protein
MDLYRDGTFTTQKSWLWCTAAGVQIVRNIVDEQEDHSTSGQRRYFNYMREHNRYTLPLSAGVDPQGWTAGLRRFVDDRYRLVTSTTFDNALRSAVKRLRLTNLPVALTVSHGTHGWILTGFTATADPARTASFNVTSVRVVGPLYGLQSRNGYDMPPDTKLTPTQLKRYFTRWWYAPKRMMWDGRYVSIQPVPVAAAAASPAASAAPSTAPSTGDEAGAIASTMPTALPTSAIKVEPQPGIGQVEPAPARAPTDEGGPPVFPVVTVVVLGSAGTLILGALARTWPRDRRVVRRAVSASVSRAESMSRTDSAGAVRRGTPPGER